jgi:hypothetical protein
LNKKVACNSESLDSYFNEGTNGLLYLFIQAYYRKEAPDPGRTDDMLFFKQWGITQTRNLN